MRTVTGSLLLEIFPPKLDLILRKYAVAQPEIIGLTQIFQVPASHRSTDDQNGPFEL